MPQNESIAAGTAKKSACLLSLSRIPDDPRVRRQGDALSVAGWDVCGVGLSGALSARPRWPCQEAQSTASTTQQTLAHAVALRSARGANLPMRAAGLVGNATKLSWEIATHAMSRMRTVTQSQKARFSLASALDIYWSWSPIQELHRVSQGVRADLWIANDWQMLPLAARLADERGGAYVYDTHEFAIYEYMEQWKWRLVRRPIARAIEAHYVKNAKVVSTVSEGIASGLQLIYQLPSRPLVIRNVPSYQVVNPALEGPKIRVLYHGLVSAMRGLEPMIRSVKSWRDEFDLTIRGPGNEDYLNELRGLIKREGVGSRVRIEPPIPMTELIAQAAPFDVGFFCMPERSQQHHFVLPNKLFEYIMAGLAVCVSDLPEMSQIVKEFGVGILLPSAKEQDISAAVNSLTRRAIRSFKQSSLEAAKRLCWEQECQALLAAYNSKMGAAN